MPVVGEQAGAASGQRRQRVLRQRVRAVGGVARAPELAPAGLGDHVVKRGDRTSQAGERGRDGRVGVDDRAHARPMPVDVAMQAPFAGREEVAARPAVERDLHHVGRAQVVAGNPGRRHQESARGAAGDVSRGAGVEATLGQPANRLQDLAAHASSGSRGRPRRLRRKQRRQPFARGGRDAPLGDDSGDQPRGRQVEAGVRDRASPRAPAAPSRARPPSPRPESSTTSLAARSSITTSRPSAIVQSIDDDGAAT